MKRNINLSLGWGGAPSHLQYIFAIVRMRSLLSLLTVLNFVFAAPSAPQWSFDLKQSTSGIVALESIVVSPTLAIFFNRPSLDPLHIDNHSALGALWDLRTSTVRPLEVVSDAFCGSGALISNGSMVIAIDIRQLILD